MLARPTAARAAARAALATHRHIVTVLAVLAVLARHVLAVLARHTVGHCIILIAVIFFTHI